MTEDAGAVLQWVVGGRPVSENLRNAVESGKLLQGEDGMFLLPPSARAVSPCMAGNTTPHLGCKFLAGFLFQCAYARAAVPFGCKECYKVTVAPATLRGLVALKSIQEGIACHSKCCVEADRPETQNLYAGFFYCVGLDRAREVYRQVREAVSSDPKLGAGVPVKIKRGCTGYELHCGPSDRFEFAPHLPELEAFLRGRFRNTRTQGRNEARDRIATFGLWVQTAFMIGDDTYLDFTGGKRLYPETVVYDPEPGGGT